MYSRETPSRQVACSVVNIIHKSNCAALKSCFTHNSSKSLLLGNSVRVGPLAVEEDTSGLVFPLERVRSKEVALALHQTGSIEVSPAVLVKVGQAGVHRGDGQPNGGTQADHSSPGHLALLDLGLKLGVHKKVDQIRVLLVRVGDALEELGADDAPTLETNSPETLVERLQQRMARYKRKETHMRAHSPRLMFQLNSLEAAFIKFHP